MFKFDELVLVQSEEIVKEKKDKTRFILGCDPADVPSKEGLNVFTVYDKQVMRVVCRVETKLTFDEWTEQYLKREIDQRLYKVSKKFINGTGSRKTINEIRTESQA